MEPKACLQRAEDALYSSPPDLETAYYALQDYEHWRRNGGFQSPEGGDERQYLRLQGRLEAESREVI